MTGELGKVVKIHELERRGRSDHADFPAGRLGVLHKRAQIARWPTPAGDHVQHTPRPTSSSHRAPWLCHYPDPGRQVTQPWRGSAPLALEYDHDQLGCYRVVAYFLGRELFGLQQCRQGGRIISSLSVAAGN